MRRPVLLALLLLALPAWAERPAPLEAQLKELLLDKTVTLRTFYTGERLRFDAAGGPLEAGPPGPWTTDAQIRVLEVGLTPTALRLRGRRLHFVFGMDGSLHHHNDGLVTVELALAAPLRNRAEASQVIARVFMRTDEKLTDFVPVYWKYLLTSQWQSVEFAFADVLPGETLYTPGRGDVTWPKVIGRGDSLDAPIAVCGQIEGEVGLAGVVGPDGSLLALQVVSPFGLGLDDRAADLVSKWRFEPARKGRELVSTQVDFWIWFRRDACGASHGQP